MSSYAFHPEARLDLDQIWDYIADHDIAAADRVIGEVFDKLQLLADAPHIGHRRPDLTSRPLRFAAVRDYLIAYAPDTRPLFVISVIHGRRNPRVLATVLSGRNT